MAFGLFYVNMFFEVCIDVVNKALDPYDLDRECAVDTLCKLATAVRRNHHVVFIPLLSEEMIRKLDNVLGKNEVVSLQYCFKKKRDLFALGKIIKVKAIVSFKEPEGNVDNVIYFNPKFTSQFEYNEECHLLTENIMDSEFFAYITKAYQKNSRVDSGLFRIKFFPVQGGGSTIKDVFVYECKLCEHFCLCIMDSDKKWPNCTEYGQTAKEFIKYIEERNISDDELSKCRYYIMQNVCEIENLIPMSVLKHFCSVQTKWFLMNHMNIIQWLDLKNGFEYKLLYYDEAYTEWKKVLPNEIPWQQIDNIKLNVTDIQEFKDRLKSANFPLLFTPWGGKLMDKILHPDSKHCGKYNLYETALGSLLPGQKTEWLTIGSLIFSWCCCFSNKII